VRVGFTGKDPDLGNDEQPITLLPDEPTRDHPASVVTTGPDLYAIHGASAEHLDSRMRRVSTMT
jgi:hypothetical protein